MSNNISSHNHIDTALPAPASSAVQGVSVAAPAVLASVLLVLSGCAKDSSSRDVVRADGSISFTATVQAPAVDDLCGGAQTRGVFSLVDENGAETEFSLVEEFTDMSDPMTCESVSSPSGQPTRADLMDADEFKSKYGSFWVSAFSAGSKYLDIEKLTVDKPESGDTWAFSDGKVRTWAGSSLEFFAWAPASTEYSGGQAWSADPVFAPGQGSTATATLTDYTLSDPQTQADLLLGYCYGTKSSETGTATLKFSHLLTAVTFEVGEDVQADPVLKDYKVNYIEIKGMAGKATCTATLSTSPAIFSWAVGSTADWRKTFGEGGIALSSLQTALDTMLFIPQTFGKDAKLCLNISGPTETYTIYYALEGRTWTSGKVQKYSITFKGTPAVTVDDTVEGSIKKNLVIKNTGDCKAWIRAAIVGYWCDQTTHENMKAWIETSGTFVLPSPTRWEKCESDGFWYYLDPVPADTETPEQLFSSYSCPTAPQSNLYLKMFVMVQAVKYDADKALAKSAWGNDTPITK